VVEWELYLNVLVLTYQENLAILSSRGQGFHSLRCSTLYLYSYKLWYNYLKLRRRQVKAKCVTDMSYEEVNNAFERCVIFLHKVGKGWCVIWYRVIIVVQLALIA